MVSCVLLSLLSVFSLYGLTFAVENPEEYVNILGGTDSRYDLSHGNTLPLIARPWGFNAWSPYTDTDNQAWYFHPYDNRFFGIRCTHQPSPWINDYGQFVVNAIMVDPDHDGIDQYSAYNPKTSSFSPYYFRAEQLAYATSKSYTALEFTSTNHGAIMQVAYPEYEENSGFNQTRRIIVKLNGGSDSSQITTLSDGALAITGYSKANSGGIASEENYAHHFVIGLYSKSDKPISTMLDSSATSSAAWIDLSASDETSQYVIIRIGTSFISADQALLNMEREVGSPHSFEDIASDSKKEWRATLSRVNVGGIDASYSNQEKENLLTTFYSTLYRASLFPRQLSEVNADGVTVHWSPYSIDGSVYEGPLSTDSGFWDAYSTVCKYCFFLLLTFSHNRTFADPLLSLVNVDRLSLTIQGWLTAYKEGEWLPKWASPGYRGSMVGTMGDVSLADAIVKNIPGFDRELAYEAIRKDAFQQPEEGSDGGRECLSTYIKHGYIPRNAPSDAKAGTCGEVVSRTLDYFQADFAISQAAVALGYNEDAETLMMRSSNYSIIFDEETGMIRSRYLESGKFTEPFDQYAWGGDYTEAGPWQYRFSVPYDPEGLAQLYLKGDMNICDALDKMQTTTSAYHIGSYSSQIHEMTEMAVNCWGQYEHGNQPVHHILYMFGAAGGAQCASKGQYYLRKAMRELYASSADMFAGDEDNGEMSAWYVLSSLGLYSLSPGTEDMVFGSPLFSSVTVDLKSSFSTDAAEKFLVIEAENNSADNVYVQKISWNGEELSSEANSIKYSSLMQGGTLKFFMGPTPRSSF